MRVIVAGLHSGLTGDWGCIKLGNPVFCSCDDKLAVGSSFRIIVESEWMAKVAGYRGGGK